MKTALRIPHKHNCRITNHKCVVKRKGGWACRQGNELELINAHEISTQLSNPQPERTLLQNKHHTRGRSMEHCHMCRKFILNTGYINSLKLFSWAIVERLALSRYTYGFILIFPHIYRNNSTPTHCTNCENEISASFNEAYLKYLVVRIAKFALRGS